MATEVVRRCLVVLVLICLLVLPAFAFPLKREESLNAVKEVNSEGPYIGLVTVFPPEETAFFAIAAFEPHRTHPFVDLSGLDFLHLCFLNPLLL